MSTRGALVLMDIIISFNIVQDISLLKNKATSFVVTQLCQRYEVHVLFSKAKNKKMTISNIYLMFINTSV